MPLDEIRKCVYFLKQNAIEFTPPPLAKLATLLLLAALAWPVQAQLVIPATTGADACTQGGLSEVRTATASVGSINTTSATLSTLEITNSQISDWRFSLTSNAALRVAVMENGGSSDLIGDQSLGNVPLGGSLSAQNVNFSNLKKNTRYVAVVYTTQFGSNASSPYTRLCFKTRGEFTNAEQNLFFDGFEWQPNLTRYDRTGCYAVASTRQDIRDCYCNGTRNGTHILAGQTVASQAQRRYLNCPDLDS